VVFEDWVMKEPAQEAIVRGVGGYVIKPLPLINGMAVALPSPAVGAAATSAHEAKARCGPGSDTEARGSIRCPYMIPPPGGSRKCPTP
jgi:hypothetical protein